MADKRQQQLEFIRKRDGNIKRFMADFERWLGTSTDKILRQVKRTATAAQLDALDSAAVLAGIEDAFRELGLEQQLVQIELLYGMELQQVRREFEQYQRSTGAASQVLTSADIDVAEALVSFDMSEIDRTIGKYATELRSATMRNVIGGELVDIDQMAEMYGERVARNIETDLQTGLTSFNQAVSNYKAKRVGVELWVYLGPDDNKTRPFCQDYVNKVITNKERAGLVNYHGMPADIYRGGYNCRHHWRPIRAEEAEEEYGFEV